MVTQAGTRGGGARIKKFNHYCLLSSSAGSAARINKLLVIAASALLLSFQRSVIASLEGRAPVHVPILRKHCLQPGGPCAAHQ